MKHNSSNIKMPTRSRKEFWAALCAAFLVLVMLLTLLPVLNVFATGNTGPNPPKPSETTPPKPSETTPQEPIASSGGAFVAERNRTGCSYFCATNRLQFEFKPSRRWHFEAVDKDELEVLEVELVIGSGTDFPFYVDYNRYLAFPLTDSKHTYKSEYTNYGTTKAVFDNLRTKKDVSTGYHNLTFSIHYKSTSGGKTVYAEDQITIPIYFEGNSVPELKPTAKIVAGDAPIISGSFGQQVQLNLSLVNRGAGPATILNVAPVVSGDVGAFPFEITRTDYNIAVNRPLMPAGTATPDPAQQTRLDLDYGAMTMRQDVKTGYVPLTFKVDYLTTDSGETQSAEVQLFINCIGKPEEKEKDKDGKTSIPRLLIKSFKTEPQEIMGGQPFTLHVELENTSQLTLVQNIRLALVGSGDVQPFLPASGASATFIPMIMAGQTVAVDIPMEAAAKAEAKSYPLTVDLEFEDGANNAIKAGENITLVLHQEHRVDIGKVEISPENINVGQEANLMFPIYNKGKTTLYNVSVLIPEGQGISAGESYLGNFEPGANKSADLMVRADDASMATGKYHFVIQFEDENGKAKRIEKEFDLIVMEQAPIDEGMMPDIPMEEENQGTPWWVWGGGAAVTAALAGGILAVILKKKKAKRLAHDLADDDEY